MRADAHGGRPVALRRVTLETAKAVRAAVGPDFIVGMRSSRAKVNDFVYKWRGEDQAAEVYNLLGRLGSTTSILRSSGRGAQLSAKAPASPA